ncbi:MAG: undecaprenyl-diphosphate phosphatase [Coprococcus sp.]|nr:undecaprenyl-diphosphate phosphatase [Coprococcus sp.]
MNLLQAIIMGIIQGATEFLPVSSSGHLAIFRNIFHMNTDTGILFDILLHLGTLVAIIIIYRRDIGELLIEGFTILGLVFVNIGRFINNLYKTKKKKKYVKIATTPYRRFVILVLFSTFVTMCIALPFEHFIGNAGNTLLIPGICLVVTSAVLYIADNLKVGNKNASTATYKDSVMVGLAQGAATLPGLSRSGSTIAAGLACGFTREFAVKYSFIMSIPAILGACILELPDLAGAKLSGREIFNYIVGMVVAGVVGFVCIKFMLRVVKTNKFKGFSIYCLCAGLISIVCYMVL